MTLSCARTLEDGCKEITENSGTTDVLIAVLRPGQWEVVANLPEDDQRARLNEFVLFNQANPDWKSDAEELSMSPAHEPRPIEGRDPR